MTKSMQKAIMEKIVAICLGAARAGLFTTIVGAGGWAVEQWLTMSNTVSAHTAQINDIKDNVTDIRQTVHEILLIQKQQSGDQ